MAQTIVMNAQTAVIAVAAATAFTTTGPFVADAMGLNVGEYVILNRRMSDGVTYKPATNEKGSIILSAIPNTIVV